MVRRKARTARLSTLKRPHLIGAPDVSYAPSSHEVAHTGLPTLALVSLASGNLPIEALDNFLVIL